MPRPDPLQATGSQERLEGAAHSHFCLTAIFMASDVMVVACLLLASFPTSFARAKQFPFPIYGSENLSEFKGKH